MYVIRVIVNMVRTDKASVTQAASVLAKASWKRNAKRRAMVENKKKREVGKVKRRKQVKKIMKDVDKQRAGAALQALPKAQKKKKKENKKRYRVDPSIFD